MAEKDHLLSIVRAMPKIDLHRHLEGSMRLETLVEIARDFHMANVDYQRLRPQVQMMPDDPRTWERFLSKFSVLRQFFRSPEIVKRVTREVIADAAADNVKYLELRFTPQALNNLMGCSYDTVISWVCEATTEAMSEYDIQVRLIVSMNRHESIEIGMQVLHAALNYSDCGVTGIDLAGQEALYSSRPFQGLFAEAKASGLGVTIHAGEWDGAHNIADAIHYLGADRIGHGVRLVENSDLMMLLVERGTVLEICPTSNFQSGVVNSMAQHPLPDLFYANVRTTINTDDPLISDITLSNEIVEMLLHTSLTMEDIKQQTLTAARAAFLPPAEREALVARFETLLAAVEYS